MVPGIGCQGEEDRGQIIELGSRKAEVGFFERGSRNAEVGFFECRSRNAEVGRKMQFVFG